MYLLRSKKKGQQVTIQNFFDEGKEGTLVLLNDGVGDGSHRSVGPSLTLVKVLRHPRGRWDEVIGSLRDLLTRKSKKDGWRTQTSSPRMRNPAK
jgi:hypothetical protein